MQQLQRQCHKRRDERKHFHHQDFLSIIILVITCTGNIGLIREQMPEAADTKY